MNDPIAGRAALVTGASSGLGEAIARALAQAGANLAISARRIERLEEVAKDINGNVLVMQGDVSIEEEAYRIVEHVVDEFAGIDILVNSAGVIDAGGLESLPLDRWRRVIEINLYGTIHMCKAVLPHMKARGAGDIVNISSTAGRRAAGLMGAYSTSKFGLTGFTESLRQEMGECGVRVAIVEPGATETEIASGIGDPAMREGMRQHVTREGVMQPGDIAEAIMFLLRLPRRANVSQMLIRPTDDTKPF